jgi:murein DD-endopeptidase MepM/ murein hydrolase activator NlpD
MKLLPPWPAKYSINARSPYGPRKHPITGRIKMHHGVDVAMPVGTELVAPADGEVVHKGSGASGGYTLIVKHADDLYTVYYHLQKPSMLPVGTKVRTGQLIAYSGNTGASTGPHLHWETRRSRKWGDTFNPLDVLQSEPVAEPAPVPEPQPEPVKPQATVQPPRKPKPMSAGLKRFFEIRRALK